MGINVTTLSLSKKYSNKVSSGIKSIESKLDKLIFELPSGEKIEVTLNGLSQNSFTNIYKDKLDNLNEIILSKFEYKEGILLFEGKNIGEKLDIKDVIDDSKSLENKTYSSDKIEEKFVKKENGKRLSTNDYIDQDKNKVNSLNLNNLEIAYNHSINPNNPHETKLTKLNDVIIENPIEYEFLGYQEGKFKNLKVKDEKVKMNESLESKYLEDFLDNASIVNENGILKIKTIDGLLVTLAEINNLKGLNKNIMTLLNSLTTGMEFRGVLNSYSNLSSVTNPNNGDTVIIKTDENNNNKQMTYIYVDSGWNAINENTLSIRDFKIDKLDLINESKGILPKNRMDLSGLALRDDLNSKMNISDYTGEGKVPVNLAKGLHGLEKTIVELNDSVTLSIHKNRSVLDRLGENSGNLTFNGKTIEGSSESSVIDLNDIIKKSEYDKNNNGTIDECEKSEIIKCMENSKPFMYYGTDNKGVLGSHFLPINNSYEDTKIEQRTSLNVKSGDRIIIPSLKNLSTTKCFTECYKFKEGVNDIKIDKLFDNSNKDNFIYLKEEIDFDTSMHIKNKFNYETSKMDFSGIYESGLINRDEYSKLVSFKSESVAKKDVVLEKGEGVLLVPNTINSDNFIDTNGGLYITSASSIWDTNYKSYMALDNVSKGSYWSSTQANAKNCYFQIKMPEKCYLSKFKLELRLGGLSSAFPKILKLFGSIDGENFESITDYNCSTWTINMPVSFEVNCKKRYVYYRFSIEENYGNYYTALQGLQLYGTYFTPSYFIKENEEIKTIKDGKLIKIEEPITLTSLEENGFNNLDSILAFETLKKFSLISNSNELISLNGLKKTTGMAIGKESIITSISRNIDFFEMISSTNSNSIIKLCFSIDDGVSWYSYDGGFKKIALEIPQNIQEFTEQDLVKWENAKMEILNSGINYQDLKGLNFNNLTFKNIKFVYVLSQINYDDVCENKNLKFQFDSKGSMKKMKDSEYDLEIYEESVEVMSLIENEIIKINILS